MAAWSQSYYRALLVPDWRYSGQPQRGVLPTSSDVWAAQSSYTEAGPHPGSAQDRAGSDMSLEVLGEYDSTPTAGSYVYLGITRGGHATRTGSGAHVGWTTDSLAGSVFYGWDRPGTMYGQELLDATASLDESRSPCLLTIPSSGKVLCAYQNITDASSPASFTIKCRTRNAITGTWASAVTVYSGSTDYSSAVAATISNHAGPCLVLLPGERVLCLVLHEDVTANTITVRSYYSDDQGATWALGSPTVLPASIATGTYTIRKIAAAYLDGQIVMFLWRMTPGAGPSDVLLQYASSDLGMSFVQVSSTTNAGLPCVVADSGRFVVAYVPRSGQTNASDPCWSILGSAWSPLDTEYAATSGTKISSTDAAAYDGSSNIDQASKLALCVDEQGILYAYWGATDVYGAMQDGTLASTTGTWEPMGASSGQPVFDFAAGDYLREITATCQRGRAYIAGSNTASTATTDSYLAVWTLGGYTNIELPPFDLAVPWYIASTGSYANIPCTWAPVELPQNTGWTAAGTAATEAISTSGTDWYLRTTTSANSRNYAITSTASNTGIMATGVTRSNNAVATASVLLLRVSDGATTDYQIEVRVDQTNIKLYDVGAATTDATAAHGIDMAGAGNWIQILAAMNNGKCSVWYRQYDRTESKKWIALATNNTLTAATLAANNAVLFGTNGAAATYSVDWMHVGHISAAPVGQNLATGAQSFVHGRPIGSRPLYITNGLSVRATGGPAIGNVGLNAEPQADRWLIPPRYDYQVDNLDPRLSPSPRDTWRSTQAAADEYIAYALDSLDDAYVATGIVGVHLQNINFGQALLEYHNGTTWASLMTVTAAQKITYARNGESFEITFASAGWTGVLREDELVGGHLQLGTTSAATVRKINRSTGGVVVSGDAQRRPRVYCDNVDAGDSASGTGYIWFPQVTGIVAPTTTTTSGYLIKGLRIRPDDNSTYSDPPEGYFEAGIAFVGNVYVFGLDPDANRTIGRTANVEITEDRSRRTRSKVRGPVRRTVSMSWQAPGVNQRPLYDLADFTVAITTPDTGQMAALRHEAALLAQGLIDHLDGPGVPVVYLPRVAAGFAAQSFVQGQIYGRLSEDLDVTTQFGDEDDDELVTFSLSLTEEV